MLTNPWFRKWIPEFFSSPPLHQWWEKYLSAYRLNEEDKIFLSYYTEEEYLALFPEYWYVGARYKTTVLDSLLTLRHWQKTGLWEYFYTERNPSLYFEYLNNGN